MPVHDVALTYALDRLEALSKGRFVFSIDSAGNSTWDRAGTLVDLCEALAP